MFQPKIAGILEIIQKNGERLKNPFLNACCGVHLSLN
jgi:hypothetical protein